MLTRVRFRVSVRLALSLTPIPSLPLTRSSTPCSPPVTICSAAPTPRAGSQRCRPPTTPSASRPSCCMRSSTAHSCYLIITPQSCHLITTPSCCMRSSSALSHICPMYLLYLSGVSPLSPPYLPRISPASRLYLPGAPAPAPPPRGGDGGGGPRDATPPQRARHAGAWPPLGGTVAAAAARLSQGVH